MIATHHQKMINHCSWVSHTPFRICHTSIKSLKGWHCTETLVGLGIRRATVPKVKKSILLHMITKLINTSKIWPTRTRFFISMHEFIHIAHTKDRQGVIINNKIYHLTPDCIHLTVMRVTIDADEAKRLGTKARLGTKTCRLRTKTGRTQSKYVVVGMIDYSYINLIIPYKPKASKLALSRNYKSI